MTSLISLSCVPFPVSFPKRKNEVAIDLPPLLSSFSACRNNHHHPPPFSYRYRSRRRLAFQARPMSCIPDHRALLYLQDQPEVEFDLEMKV